jgi:hypothetical protein
MNLGFHIYANSIQELSGTLSPFLLVETRVVKFMRMWMVDTKTMCRKDLLGEHVETHMILGTLNSGIRLDGYVRNNLLELKNLKKRHDELADEMVRRGYNHQSPLDWKVEEIDSVIQSNEVKNSKVDRSLALVDLHDRCPECRERYSS